MSKVKVILQADVAGLGEEGEVKDVAGGYARNYLLPKRLVVPATKGNLKVVEQQRAEIEVKQAQHRSEARTLADRLATVPLYFPVRVGEQGRLYGSVTAQDVAAKLKSEAGIEIDRRTIELREPLRSLGQFDVPVRVAHAVTGHLAVTLHDQTVPPQASAPEASAPQEPAPSTETGPEALAEDGVPLGAVPVDTVVPASETAPEPFDTTGQAGQAGTGEQGAEGTTAAQ